MDPRLLDHAYHRSRVDANLQGTVAFAVLIAAMAFIIGDKFKPFVQGVGLWSTTSLVWTPETRIWQPAEQLWTTDEVLDQRDRYVITPVLEPTADNDSPQVPTGEYVVTRADPGGSGRRLVREVYPISYSGLLVIGTLLVWAYFYTCARRQADRMLRAAAECKSLRPYDRPWTEIRGTFWALLGVLLVELFLFLL
jgi:hypothetical protein